LASLKNFTLPVVFTASPAVMDIRTPDARRDNRGGGPATNSSVADRESAAGAVLQGPHAREDMRANPSAVKRAAVH
jgi:hypothetical protein